MKIALEKTIHSRNYSFAQECIDGRLGYNVSFDEDGKTYTFQMVYKNCEWIMKLQSLPIGFVVDLKDDEAKLNDALKEHFKCKQ
jgi:hypothetical protein